MSGVVMIERKDLIRLLMFIILASLRLWSQQALKQQQVDHRTPVHGLTFTLAHGQILPATVTIKLGIYQLRCRNGMFAKNVTFDVSRSGQPAAAGDDVPIIHKKSAQAFGYFRFTPGKYEITVREYPAYKATLEVRPQ